MVAAWDIGQGDLVLSMSAMVFFMLMRLLVVRELATRGCTRGVEDVR